ncbi:hypothetical protein MNB_SV-6-130 [hydrothermal vent metagenome]|uniref:Uncharacterized protein n=1 Tax=hydrothermal vent metagenome TaxID=652676 RepID=A0A1W1BWF1_9ZZZZ
MICTKCREDKSNNKFYFIYGRIVYKRDKEKDLKIFLKIW